MPTVTETLLRWRPARRGRFFGLQVVIDPADFDVDPETEERHPRIVGFWISSPKKRGVEFCWGTRDYSKWPRYVVGTGKPRFLPAPPVRVTYRGFSWDYTPDHVSVLPGSVSAPSLLTSGGNATASASDVTAAFTPTASSLLVVGWATRRATTPNTTHAFTNTHAGSGAWTTVEVAADTADTPHLHSQARSQVGAAPGSGTITNTYSASNPNRKSWIVAEVTGHNTATPVAGSNTGGASTGTTLSSTLAGTDGNTRIRTIQVQGTADILDGGTELAEADSGGTANLRSQMAYVLGVASFTDWTWVGSNRNAGAAVEYAASPTSRSHAIIMG